MSKQVEAVVISTIKSLSDLKIKPNEVIILHEIINETGIIIPEHIKDSSITKDRLVIKEIGSNVTECEVGDIVLDADIDRVRYYNITVEGEKEEPYMILDKHFVYLAIEPEGLV